MDQLPNKLCNYWLSAWRNLIALQIANPVHTGHIRALNIQQTATIQHTYKEEKMKGFQK